MKICPNCHNENLQDAKFCVFCGFNLANVAETAKSSEQATASKATANPEPEPTDNSRGSSTNFQEQSANTQTAQETGYSTNYSADNAFNQFVSYFKSSIINPSNEIEAPRYGGLMSIGVYVVLMLVIFGLAAKRIIDLVVSQSQNEFTVNILAPIKTAIMQFSGILIISALAYLLVAFTVRRTLLNDNITFLDFTDMFGVYVNISSVLLLLCLILSLFVSITSYTLMGTIIMIFALSQAILNYAVVMTLKDIQGRFNNFYSILIAEIVPAIIVLWATSVYLQNIYGSLSSWYNGLNIQ